MLCEPLGLGRVELTTKTANADYGEFTVCATHVLCPCIDADAQGNDIKCLTTIVADGACGRSKSHRPKTVVQTGLFSVCLRAHYNRINSMQQQCRAVLLTSCVYAFVGGEKGPQRLEGTQVPQRRTEQKHKHHACPTGIQCL